MILLMADSEKKVHSGRWVKGQSGNPGGRRGPAAMAKKIREKVGAYGQELVDFHYDCFKGTLPDQQLPDGSSSADKERVFKSRVYAASWLSDRGFGKAPQIVEIKNKEREKPQVIIDMEKMSDEDLLLLESAGKLLEGMSPDEE